MAHRSQPTPNFVYSTPIPSAGNGHIERGLVGSISADQVTSIQVGTSGGEDTVQPASGESAAKE
jgi:hypothetical protein